jgi:hypothetical protein
MDINHLSSRIAALFAGLGTAAIIVWELIGRRDPSWAPESLAGNHGGISYVGIAVPIAAIALFGLATGRPTGTLGRCAFGLNVAILVWLSGRFLHAC